MSRTSPTLDERMVAAASLGESLAALRVLSDDAVRPMRLSLEHQGQLTALATYRDDDGTLQVIDGFTRLRAARALGWSELRVRVLPIDVVAATAALATLNRGHALTELEEAWLCRALYRLHKLTQPEIARLLGHDKSWVCRRLTLAESLHEQLQADVRLGLIGARVAADLGRLSRDNQPMASTLAQRRGLTVAQTARVVQTVLALPDADARARWLNDALAERAPLLRATPAPRAKTEADLFLGDIETVTRVASRLQVRLRDKPLDAFEPAVAALLTEAMGASAPVLTHLSASITRALARRDLRDVVLE